ncbi:hypothetical protein LIER_22902 [Lithospermum erythrorhizon]|uniref:Uncharacterized protein n=1 Tax=Lithospermum erythrorhizon TaxID=34254 RepID=A0AAV3QZ57_LITER
MPFNCQNMAYLRPIISHHHYLFTTQNHSQFIKSFNLNPFVESNLLISSIIPQRLNLLAISQKPFCSSPEFVQRVTSEIRKLAKSEKNTIKTKKPFLKSDILKSSIFLQRLNIFAISQRPFCTSDEFVERVTLEIKKLGKGEKKSIVKKPLDVFFKEAVGIVEKCEEIEEDLECENGELKKRLKNLEDEVRSIKTERKIERLKMKEKGEVERGKMVIDGLKIKDNEGEMEIDGLKMEEKNGNCKDGDSGNESKKRSLSALFVKKENKDGGNSRRVDTLRMEDSGAYKELSPDMIMFVTHLYKEGYFKDSNFLRRNKFSIGCFENSYARDFVKFAAEQFGKDSQEIAKWLSASDLKKVALFGCPSLARKNVFSAKRLRTFFRIQENTVCDRCVLKKSCRFVNQSVWKGDTKSLNLAVIMRVITIYALESVPSELVVPEEIKSSVGRLLKEAVNLSGTVKKIS